MKRFTVISGCSGGGKSTLLAELARRGHSVVEEPGRRIVRQEAARRSTALLPWIDPAAFARRATEIALDDLAKAETSPARVFFDRGLVDAASALAHFTGEPIDFEMLREHRYGRRVFLTPPWPEIFESDAERPHGFEAAVAEYERLLRTYSTLDYEARVLPKVPVAERADILLDLLREE